MAGKLKITLVKSPIGAVPKQKATVVALGLNKMHKTEMCIRDRGTSQISRPEPHAAKRK